MIIPSVLPGPFRPQQGPPAPFMAERWPLWYRQVAESLGPDNPLLRMGASHPDEALPDEDALPDPVGERHASALPFVLHKHPDRALILTTDRCFFSCRFCFRRGNPLHAVAGLGRSQWEGILHWLRGQEQIREVILSGGDPLTLGDRDLRWIGRELEQVRHLERWRIHTRAPVVLPERVTPALLRALETALPLRVVIHANHPQELALPVRHALVRLQRTGHPVLCQSVLLAGVNDCPETLQELFRQLHGLGAAPYYLHHPDRAPGNRRFRVSIRRGKQIVGAMEREMKHETGADRMPRYVLDLPNGAGKCGVRDLRVVAEAHAGRERRLRYRWVRPDDWRATVPDPSCEWWDIAEKI